MSKILYSRCNDCGVVVPLYKILKSHQSGKTVCSECYAENEHYQKQDEEYGEW